MPTELLEHQHELTTEDEALSFVFGTGDTGYLTTAYPVISGSDGQNGDVARVREDGLSLGEDFTGGKTVAFEVSVLTDYEDNPTMAGSDALALFEAVWKSRALRDQPTKYAILRSMVGGRVRRAYGRPRRYDELAGNLTRKGVTPVVCDFMVPDSTWYDDEEQSTTVSMLASVSSGLIAPLITPLTTTAISTTSSGLTVGGKAPTWPVMTFNGPIENPVLRFNGDLTIGLNLTLGSGESVTVDPRPWRRVVYRVSDGANRAGSLNWDTPAMRHMVLPPGVYDAVLDGRDATGTATCEIRWRPAYPRW